MLLRRILLAAMATLGIAPAAAVAAAFDVEAAGSAGGDPHHSHLREQRQQPEQRVSSTSTSLRRGDVTGDVVHAATFTTTPTTSKIVRGFDEHDANAAAGRNLKGMMTTRCEPRKIKGRVVAGPMGRRCRLPTPPIAPRTATPTRAPTSAPLRNICSNLTSNPNNGHLYLLLSYDYISTGGISWPDANDTVNSFESCCGKRPHLASITSQDENDYLLTLFPSDGRPRTVWIGLHNRSSSDGTFRWEGTDEPPGYEFWCTPERNCDPTTVDPSETCVGFFSSGGSPGYIQGVWIPHGCSYYSLQGAIIEYDCSPNPA